MKNAMLSAVLSCVAVMSACAADKSSDEGQEIQGLCNRNNPNCVNWPSREDGPSVTNSYTDDVRQQHLPDVPNSRISHGCNSDSGHYVCSVTLAYAGFTLAIDCVWHNNIQPFHWSCDFETDWP